jgi:hypothetical protein
MVNHIIKKELDKGEHDKGREDPSHDVHENTGLQTPSKSIEGIKEKILIKVLSIQQLLQFLQQLILHQSPLFLAKSISTTLDLDSFEPVEEIVVHLSNYTFDNSKKDHFEKERKEKENRTI